MHDHHDAAVAGHLGFDKCYENISRYFFWPRLADNLRRYIASCDTCQRTKSSTQQPAGLLQPLEVPKDRWEQVSMDFIIQLPPTKRGHDAITVIVDRFSKMTHLAPCKTEATAPEIAQIFFDTVFKHHGMPLSIVSDRDAKFTSEFWKSLMKKLGTKLAMSTAFHPQTDGQTERNNRTLEQMLRAYVNHKQNDWDEHLTAAEFAINNSIHPSTKMTPFRLATGRDPIVPTALLTPHSGSTDRVQATEDFFREIANNVKIATDNLLHAQAQQAKYANQNRREEEFKEGDQVLLSTANFTLGAQKGRPSKKLQHRFAGPFKILKKISSVAYKLELPPSTRMHPVFHVSLLKPYQEDQFSRQPPPPPPIVTDDGITEHEVERILDKKVKWRTTYYLVKWAGYPEHEATWEKAGDCKNAAELIQEYEQQLKEGEKCKQTNTNN
jgi:hypothetical protein